MTTTPPSDPGAERDSRAALAADAEAAKAQAANTSARAKLLGWARRSIDLVPTSWLITGAGAVLLAVTALFGGLEAAAVDPIPEVAVGETFAGSDFEMTVVGVELREERGNAAVYPDEEKDERVLVVVVDVVNTFPTPRSSVSGEKPSPVINGIHLDGIDEKPSISHADDGAGSPMLQPDVPARLLLAWIVGPDDYKDGDEIRLTFPDSTHYVAKNVMRGDYWTDVHVGATVTAEVVEVPAEVDEVPVP
ncbi:hypothetical protein [Microbacterium sp. PMB16]|uniref:hypothetical protein n=1 Tax=Microbacterium sp. PMB16 TaxID=3120157 RepID=UPI003F4B3B37